MEPFFFLCLAVVRRIRIQNFESRVTGSIWYEPCELQMKYFTFIKIHPAGGSNETYAAQI